jgi:Zn-dependent alcohol dehydrogenase
MPLSLPGSGGVGEFETIALKDVGEAFGELRRGEALRSVLVF